MTKAAALFNFFSSFGLTAYEENTVFAMKSSPDFPYITYELKTDDFNGIDVALSFSLWYRSSSWVNINAKSAEISKAIGTGLMLDCDEGRILIHRGHPFATNLGDSSDDMIKRILHSINVRFYTND